MERIVLFDIDLTMIRTHGAGSAAMTEVLHGLTGIEDGFAGVEFGGRTDVSLLREALSRHGLAGRDFEPLLARFKAAYHPVLERELMRRGGVVLPGVPGLLDALAARPGVRLGVATGNFRDAAVIKLRHFELWDRFAGGGFADDGEERAEIVAAAIRRMSGPAPVAEVVVFGDSPHDVVAAKANGATVVGVATGGSSTEVLAATGADFVFDDLADTAAVLRVVFSARGD